MAFFRAFLSLLKERHPSETIKTKSIKAITINIALSLRARGTFLSKSPTGEKIYKEGPDSHDQFADWFRNDRMRGIFRRAKANLPHNK